MAQGAVAISAISPVVSVANSSPLVTSNWEGNLRISSVFSVPLKVLNGLSFNSLHNNGTVDRFSDLQREEAENLAGSASLTSSRLGEQRVERIIASMRGLFKEERIS